MNPAVEDGPGGIGFDDFCAGDGPGYGKGADACELDQPVVKHDDFGEDAVSAEPANENALYFAGDERGVVPAFARGKTGDPLRLPAQRQPACDPFERPFQIRLPISSERRHLPRG